MEITKYVVIDDDLMGEIEDDACELGILPAEYINSILMNYFGSAPEDAFASIGVASISDCVNVETFLKHFNVPYVDNRNKGGMLWVVDTPRNRLMLSLVKKIYGIEFQLTVNGSKATKQKPGWYTKEI